VVRDIEKTYGTRRALAGVSFELANGLTGLLGPNGAGKSTLMRCLVGISSWDRGQVMLDGVDPERHPAVVRRKVGYLPERFAFPAEMRIEAYLRFVAATAKRIPRPERDAAVESALARAGLGHVRSRVVGNLSKGYRQRVGLAQALLGDPAIMILDEPTAGLDPLTLLDIRSTLVDYAADHVVVLSTHTLAEARLLCDRLLVLSAGAVVYDGPTSGMAVADRRRVRLRVAEGDNRELGSFLATCGSPPVRSLSDREVIVEVDGEQALGGLSRRLMHAGFSVVALEPTADALEEAFREAVLAQPAAGEATS
jgi:ABC-2 type transport system ATP-binding protein